MKILIKNGFVVDPSQKLEKKLDLLIENGKIIKLLSKINRSKGAKVIDAKNCVVCPGLIDIHTHLREPGHEEEETIATGTRAAAAGGITTVFCMPNTHPVIDNQTTVEFILLKAKKEGVVNVFPVGSITKGILGEELSEIGELKKAGVVGVTDDGEPVMNSKIMRRALEYSKMFNLPVISHCEDKNLSKDGVINEGLISTLLGLRGIPSQSEDIMVIRDIILSSLAGGKLHITHISTKKSVEYIRRAKKEGVNVTCDTAPHYFVLTENYIKGKKLEHVYDTNAKMKPPLRTQEDVDAIIEGLKDGTIDCIASDHAPHTLEEKSKEFDLAPFGIIGLETLLPLSVTFLYKKNKMSLLKLISKFTTNPSKIFNLKCGCLKEGFVADVTIFNPEEEFLVKKFVSKSCNSPFLGWKLKGKIKYTICNGKIVYST